MNTVNLTGRLTRDPELRDLPQEGTVCDIRLAVDGMARGRKAGFIDVAVFGKSGEAAARVLSQGWLVAVQRPTGVPRVGDAGPREMVRAQRRRECRVPHSAAERLRIRASGRGRWRAEVAAYANCPLLS